MEYMYTPMYKYPHDNWTCFDESFLSYKNAADFIDIIAFAMIPGIIFRIEKIIYNVVYHSYIPNTKEVYIHEETSIAEDESEDESEDLMDDY